MPSPDPLRHAVPKAFVVLAPGFTPSREVAADILTYARNTLTPYERIRRIEFAELPKIVSGKVRRVELRALEQTQGRRTRAAGVLRGRFVGGEARTSVIHPLLSG